MEPRIDKKSLAFTVPLYDDGILYTFYIPAPTAERAEAASPILGAIYTQIKRSNFDYLVIARDYERYAKNAAKNIAEEEKPRSSEIEQEKLANSYFRNFSAFLEASLLAATAVFLDKESKTYKTVKFSEVKLSDQAMEYVAGLYVFFYVRYRYDWILMGETEKKELVTSLTLMDYIKSLPTS